MMLRISARSRADIFIFEPAFFDVMTLFRDSQDIMGQMAADRKLHMTCRAHDILHPQIDADAIRLKQIYVNLVSTLSNIHRKAARSILNYMKKHQTVRDVYVLCQLYRTTELV